MMSNQPEENGFKTLRQRLAGCGPSGLLLWILLGIAMVVWIRNPFGVGQSDRAEISYSMFRHQVKEGNVDHVKVVGQTIEGELNEPAQRQVNDDETTDFQSFVTHLPSFGDDELLSLLEAQGVEVNAQPESDFSLTTILIGLLPFALMIGFGYVLFSRLRRQGQSLFSVGSSRAKLYDRERELTTFSDVAGADGAKTELLEIIQFLKNPERFHRLGGAIPRGVLLVGSPGTGKTLLARAVAGEADVPFFSITGSDFMEMFVGVGASRVRSMLDAAKKAAPSIIFIDELDSIGRRRGAGLGGGHDEREQTLNQLLSEMDGFEQHENVIIMAATNRPDVLDPALLRPGRFDRRITVDLPTMPARRDILEIHARNKPLADDVDLGQLARATPGFSGADLENILNEAALLAARRDKAVIEQEDIEEARDKTMLGLEREGLALTDEECRLLAYHEAGHAVVAALLPHADPIHKVTIVPRGRAMGVTQQLPEKDKYVYPREYLLDRLAVMMGGRAAEELAFDTATSGAENDLKHATQLARKMVLDWGMSERLGNVALGGRSEQVFLGEEIAQRREFSEATAREADEEVKTTLNEAFDRASGALYEHRDALDRVADALLEYEEIPGDRVLELLETGDEIVTEE
jgi:cell division protease FtsH